MSLEASIRTDLGTLELAVDINVSTGELVTLLGPNGSGKTTLLRAVAGLTPLHEGRVVLDGRILEDVATNVYTPVAERSIGYVFQEYLLFPHMSAMENVAFGLRARGSSRVQARSEATKWLDRMGLTAHAQSKPKALSGGQAQRVALARALAIRPRLLLLDEPLAALDAGARAEMRRTLMVQLQAFEGTRILVTHDPIEALSLGDRVVVMEDGRVVQSGSPHDLRARPRSDYVAKLVGINLFRGYAHGRVVTLGSGAELYTAEPHSGDVFAVVHPRAIALYKYRPEGTPRNVWPGLVAGTERVEERVRIQISGAVPVVAEVTEAAAASLGLGRGAHVWASLKAAEVTVYQA